MRLLFSFFRRNISKANITTLVRLNSRYSMSCPTDSFFKSTLPIQTVPRKYTNKDIVHIDLTSVSEHASLINGFLQNAIRSSATIKHHITGSHTMTAI